MQGCEVRPIATVRSAMANVSEEPRRYGSTALVRVLDVVGG